MAKVSVKTSGAEGGTTPQGVVERQGEGGHLYQFKRPSPLQRLRLIEAIGNSASNDLYLGQVMLAASCIRIDGDSVPFPRTKREVEALVERLGEDGMTIANEAMAELLGFEVDPETGELRKIGPTTEELAKN